MAESWPFILPFQSQAWAKSNASRSGGASITGSQQVVRSDAGFWTMRATLTLSSVGRRRGETQILAYRAMQAQLDGMAGEIDVPCITPWRGYDENGRMLNANPAAAFAPTGTGLFDHAGFGQTEPELYFADVAAAARATSMTVRFDTPEGLRPGHFFGIGHRLYLISRSRILTSADPEGAGSDLFYDTDSDEGFFDPGEEIVYDDEDVDYGGSSDLFTGESTQQIDFWPPLREAVAADTPLIVGRPVCRMRLASDDTGVLEHTPGGLASISLEFVESV
jgi:hypothetical protein